MIVFGGGLGSGGGTGMLGRVGCGAMGMERLKRMFDTGDGRQAEWANGIDRESLFVKIGSIRSARTVQYWKGLFSENVPKHNEPLQSCKFDRCARARAASLGRVRPPPSNLARTTTHLTRTITSRFVTLTEGLVRPDRYPFVSARRGSLGRALTTIINTLIVTF